MTSRCAPRCRTRTLFLGFGLPVLDEPAIGDLCLLGKLALTLSVVPCLVDARAGIAPPAPAFADLELERPQLAAGERRALEGVALLAREQMPEQHAQLACGCHQRDLRSAPRAHPLIEGPQRARRPDHHPGRLAEHVPSLAWPLL